MKITFSNLGAIKKTTLDLRPLTVIIGPNNSNKTYIAYSVYGLSQLSFGFNELIPEVEINKINDNKSLLKINGKFHELINRSLAREIKTFTDDLQTFFQDSTHKIFGRTNFEINFSIKEIEGAMKNLVRRNDYSFREKIELELAEKQLIFKFTEGKKTSNDIEKILSGAGNTIQAAMIVFSGLNYLISNNSVLLPAERNAFIITYKMLEKRRFRLLRDNRRRSLYQDRQRQLDLLKEQGDISYPQPIEDFLDFLSDVELETNFETGTPQKRIEFCEIADKIEKDIQGNNKTNFKPTKFGGKEIKINVQKGLDIDLYNASSSIKQIAPLLLYLRYRAEENDLLIIDEPEMNLHPESQARLLEVLGMLVNAGVNVLLTTHSPYFMSHLNNLIAGDMTDEKTREKQAKSLYLEDARAFLKPEDVSAYEMRQNKAGNQTLHDLHDKDYGIRWDTLSDVSADIQQKYFEIYEKSKQSSDGKEES